MNRIENSPEPVIAIKADRILDCNESALSLFGYENQKESFLQLLPQELLMDFQPNGIAASHTLLYLLDQVYEEGICKEPVICKNRQGRGFYIDLHLISFAESGGETLIISKWKASDNTGKEFLPHKDQAGSLAGRDWPAIIHTNRNGKILFADSLACSIFNFSEPETGYGKFLEDIIELPQEVSSCQSISGPDLPESGRPQETFVFTRENEKLPALVTFSGFGTDDQGSEIFQVEIRPREQVSHFAEFKDSPLLEMESLKQENRNLKRVQKKLKKTLERLRVLAEYSPDAIMQLSRKGRYLFVNSRVQSLSGISPEAFLGKSNAEIGFPEDFCKKCDEILKEVFSTGKSQRMEVLFPGGKWVDWFLMPEFNQEGDVSTVITTARDITEQKKTWLKLQKSERKLNDAFEVTKLSSWSYDFRTDEIRTNNNFNTLIGLNAPVKNNRLPAAKFIQEFVLKEDHGKIKNVVDAAIASCSEDFQEVLDFRVKTPKGEIVHILASVRLEIGENGRIVRGYGTTQDITQLRLTEQELEEYRTSLERLVETRTQELKKSEEKLADALRLANLGTWEFDPVVESFLVSEEVFEIAGTTSEIEGGNVIGVSRIKEILHQEDYPLYRESVLSAQESSDMDYIDHVELRIFRSDGEMRYIYLSIKISRSGKQVKFYGTLQDITEIRHAEFEKERLNAIIEATSDIVAIVQPEGKMTYLNKAGRDFFGLKEEENLADKTFYDFQPLRAYRAQAGKVLKKAGRLGTWSGESQYVRYDGAEIPVSQVVVAHKNVQDHVECYSTIIRDISQQKKIEQDLIFKNNELDTFVYRASHDLRGPIATLMGLYNLVQYEVKDELALNLFDMYNGQILRLNTIILTLIELTKIKEREFQPSVVNFKKTVRNVFNKLQGMTESKDMLFEYDIEPVEGYVSDEHLLFVILQNMVENSIKYKRQEVTSFVRVEVKKIKDSDRIIIKVSDNGIGIDSAIQNKIYNMFFRGNERSSGSGLGLYTLKNAVEKLGGKVTLYSVLYKGTTFKIELPPLRK